MSTSSSWISVDWPALDYAAWEATLDTLHLWTQLVGKTQLALTPPVNHWWHTTFEVSARGLLSQPMVCDAGRFQAEFDFLAHQLVLRTGAGAELRLALAPRSVADFYREYTAALATLGARVALNPAPQEFDDPTPLDRDREHAAYDAAAVERFFGALARVDAVLREFRGRFIGKCSPVQFFWGSFDLAVTRFSGRRAPAPPAGRIMREAYSHEVSSCGFWPGDRRYPKAAFYSYAAPVPAGFAAQPVRPAAAGWNATLGEFLYDYESARASGAPGAHLLEFCQSTYEAAAHLADWDRALNL